MTATATQTSKTQPIPPADGKDELLDAYKVLRRLNKDLEVLSPGYRQWFIDSAQATYPNPSAPKADGAPGN
jgi:hypothetical protein